MNNDVFPCSKDGCERTATWFIVRISQPTDRTPSCKGHISSLMRGREEHVLYPYVLKPTVKEEGS